MSPSVLVEVATSSSWKTICFAPVPDKEYYWKSNDLSRLPLHLLSIHLFGKHRGGHSLDY